MSEVDDIAADVLRIGPARTDATVCKRTVGELRHALQMAVLAGRRIEAEAVKKAKRRRGDDVTR